MKADSRAGRRAIPKPLILAVLAVLVLAVPPLLQSYELYMISLFLITTIVVAGLNLVFGYTGQASMGSAAFMGIGAYSTALLGANFGIPFPIAVILGGVLAAIAGLLIGFPALRVSGFYLILVTLAFLGALQVVYKQWSVVGGVQGMPTPVPMIGPISLESPVAIYYLNLVFAALIFWGIHSLIDSKTGRALIAIRENEIAAQSLGISLARYKVLAFAVSSLISGIGGGLYTGIIRFIDPGSFGISAAIAHILYMVVGGPGSLWGPAVGSVLVLNAVALHGFDKYREVVFALILILFLLFAPWGIVGLIKGGGTGKLGSLISRIKRMANGANSGEYGIAVDEK